MIENFGSSLCKIYVYRFLLIMFILFSLIQNKSWAAPLPYHQKR